MKTIIAGSREVDKYSILIKAVRVSGFDIGGVVSGGAKGVDLLGERYAKQYKLPLYIFKADWNKYGKGAGYIRNIDMAKNAEALLAIWDGESRGTKHMIEEGKRQGLLVHVYRVDDK